MLRKGEGMDYLAAMQAFVRSVDFGSFSKAAADSVDTCARPRARRLGKSKAVAGGQGRNGGRSIG